MATRKRKKLKVKCTDAHRHPTATQRSPHFPSDTDASDGESDTDSDSVETTRVSSTTTTTRCVRQELLQFFVNFIVPPQVRGPTHEDPSQSCKSENAHEETAVSDSDTQTREQRECPFSEAVVASIDTLSEFLRLSKLHIPDRLHLVIQLRKLELLVEKSSGDDDANEEKLDEEGRETPRLETAKPSFKSEVRTVDSSLDVTLRSEVKADS